MRFAVEARDPHGEQFVGDTDQYQRQDRDERVGEAAAGERDRLVDQRGRVAVTLAGLERDAAAPVEVGQADGEDEDAAAGAEPRRGQGLGPEERGREIGKESGWESGGEAG